MLTQVIDWFRGHEELLWWLAIGSALMLVGSAVVVPMILAVIPADYFSHSGRPRPRWAKRHPVVWIAYLAVKNVVGLLLVVAGILMLVLPGQGLLSIVAGIVLMNVPGKYRLVRWLIRRPAVLRSVNWLRRRAGREPLIVDP